jgi:hypothetical protein
LNGAPSLTPIPSTTTPGPSSTLQQPTFDPYATQPDASLAPPSLLGPPPSTTYGAPPPTYSQPYGAPPAGTQPYYAQPYPGAQQPYQGFGTQSPPVLFPGLTGQPAVATAYDGALKLFQHIRLSHAWLHGDNGQQMRINDTFATTTVACPNFLWTGQPWFISPGFGWHAWSGPWTAGLPALPANVYSAFLDVGWRSDPNRAFGGELAGRIGVFSDFTGIVDESIRPSGLALMRYNLTPNVALKAGVWYINRADIKLFPAGGILWTPSPQTRLDIFFPQPKLSCYLTTLGNNELWWYVSGEYGGGVWTPEVVIDTNADGVVDTPVRTLMDINDIRLMLGIELGPPATGGVGQRGLFFEVGYVWNREVVLVSTPSQSFDLSETFMLRGGIAF